jgi:hypothetical protein
MAHARETFPVLKNADGGGEVLDLIQSGDAVADKNGALVFGFKDTNGNAVAPTLTPEGAFFVDMSAAGTKVWARGAVPAGHVPAEGTVSYVTVVSQAIDNDATYTNLSFIASSRRDAIFQLVHDDGTTQTVLCDIILGPGQYTAALWSDHFSFTAPAEGTHSIKVRAYNFDAASELAATFACVRTA